MPVPEEVIKEVSMKTGYPEDVVKSVADKIGSLAVKASSNRIICFWAGLRCLTTIGVVRRIFWCIVASLCAMRK